MKHAFLSLMSLLFLLSSSANAAFEHGLKSREVISALRLAGFKGASNRDGRENKIVYQGSVSCKVNWGAGVDPDDERFQLPQNYECLVGRKRVAGAKAKVLYEALEKMTGSDAGMGQSWVEARNLHCSIDLDREDSNTRFFCRFDS